MEASRGARLRELARSDTGRAAGLATAVMAGNFVALAFTVVFARVLGGSGYGSLAALVSTFVILMVPGSAVQTTVAREVSGALAAGDPHPGAGVRRWLRRLVVLTVVLAVVSSLGREGLAAAIGVDDVPWAAAATLPGACVWLILSIQRGALQGYQRYRLVGSSIIGEQVARLGFGLVLVAAGLDVTGAFLGTPLALAAMALFLYGPLHAQLGDDPPAGDEHRLRELFTRAWAPVLALALIAWLQDGHVIIVKHLASSDDAGAWAAAAVAAKAIMWVAIGLGLYLVPEAARRASGGEDPRPVLVRVLALVGGLALAMVLVFAVAAEPLLRIVFDLSGASEALPWLGLALSLLALTYVAAQFQLALHRWRFIGVLVTAAVAQPLALLAIGEELTPIALGMLAVQTLLAACLLTMALRRPPAGAAAAERTGANTEEEVPRALTGA